MRTVLKWILVPLVAGLLLIALPVMAKGPADLIRIEGPDLAAPVEITDPQILNRFDPWGGQFIGTGGPLDFPARTPAPYEVFFYLQNSRGELEPIYMFYYAPGPSGTRGSIYLPGDGEPYYRLNVGTIIRGSTDGQWYKAMPAWDDLMSRQLPGFTLDTGSQSAPPPLALVAASVGTLLLVTVGVWRRQRRHSQK